MSGVSELRLLIASHIVPWSKDKQNRLNPSNGLCLSAIHDRAFDKGLISVSDDFRILVSRPLRLSKDDFLQRSLCALEGTEIALPERFQPEPAFLAQHRADIFLGD
nr:HNH endonuclease [Macromonas bipunctata]